MQDLLTRLSGEDLGGLLAITLTFVAGMIVWLSLQWRLHRRTEMEAVLKQQMLERGMSADDIERVLGARLSGGCDSASRVGAERGRRAYCR